MREALGAPAALLCAVLPDLPDGELALVFESALFENDERMKATRRRFDLKGGALRYSIDMATQETPRIQTHIQSALQRM